MSDSLKNQATKFSFGEYAETVGPQGLQFVLNGILFFGLFGFTSELIKQVKRRDGES